MAFISDLSEANATFPIVNTPHALYCNLLLDEKTSLNYAVVKE